MSNVIMCSECKMCDGDRCTYFDNDSDRESTIACILFEPKKPTNGDRIRQGGDDSLMKYAEEHRKNPCHFCVAFDKTTSMCTKSWNKSCLEQRLAWLNAPAESEGKDE